MKFTRVRRKWSPLHYAILNGSAVVATELLDQGADVDALFDGATPLVLVACDAPRYPMTVASGPAVVAHQRSSSLTPAAKRTLMRLLLDRGASPLAIRNAHRVTDAARVNVHPGNYESSNKKPVVPMPWFAKAYPGRK